MIDRFRDEHFYLSNMYVVERQLVTPDGLRVPTAEHYYMSMRFKDRLARSAIASARADEEDTRPHAHGKAAKELAHTLIEHGWPHCGHDARGIRIMKHAVSEKFTLNPDLAEKLLSTEDEELVEGNNWGDRFWGVSPIGSNTGENHLGTILMEVRNDLREMRV